MAYTVIRTDLMSGTNQPADLVSLRFYDGEDKQAAVENGVIVKLEGYEDGEREVNPIVLMGDPMSNGDLTQEYLYGEKYGMGIVLAGGNAGIGRYEIA